MTTNHSTPTPEQELLDELHKRADWVLAGHLCIVCRELHNEAEVAAAVDELRGRGWIIEQRSVRVNRRDGYRTYAPQYRLADEPINSRNSTAAR